MIVHALARQHVGFCYNTLRFWKVLSEFTQDGCSFGDVPASLKTGDGPDGWLYSEIMGTLPLQVRAHCHYKYTPEVKL